MGENEDEETDVDALVGELADVALNADEYADEEEADAAVKVNEYAETGCFNLFLGALEEL